MNKYKAFYRGKEIEVEAETSLKAQNKAAGIFKAKKPYQVTVVLLALASSPDTPVVHRPDF